MIRAIKGQLNQFGLKFFETLTIGESQLDSEEQMSVWESLCARSETLALCVGGVSNIEAVRGPFLSGSGFPHSPLSVKTRAPIGWTKITWVGSNHVSPVAFLTPFSGFLTGFCASSSFQFDPQKNLEFFPTKMTSQRHFDTFWDLGDFFQFFTRKQHFELGNRS